MMTFLTISFDEVFDKFFDEFYDEYFDKNFDDFFDNFLTIASFRMGVPLILFIIKLNHFTQPRKASRSEN